MIADVSLTDLAAWERRNPPRELPPEFAERNNPTLLTLAHHEAGHAVVALLLGLPVAFASVQPTHDASGRVSPRFSYCDTTLGRYLLFVLSGDSAERRQCLPLALVSAHGNSKDISLARDALQIYHPGIGGAALQRELRLWQKRSDRLVAAHWGWIGRTARELAAARRLTGEQIQKLRGMR